MSSQLGGMPAEVPAKRAAEREALRQVIQQWNADRLDLFELSEPNEDLLFHGVMRFYFHDSSHHVTTKCIRVASDATVNAVIETLIEKFRPDMRMLSVPEYALYVTHENGDERRLNAEEKPLLVQLNWAKDDREGRFLLKRIGDDSAMPAHTFQESSFKRKLSKREKKQLKKQEKLKRVQSTAEASEDGKVGEKLYTELPETSFTRSISNPEAVMRRRRHQKLERKLQQFRSKDGGPDTGGTLKIYGEALCGDVPYKTLLLSVRDTTASVIREMLSKYGRDVNQEANNYCLVQTNSADGTEFILDEDECPLSILMNHPATSVRKGVIIGSIMFHVRRRPADYHPRKRKKKPQQRIDYRYEDSLPFFQELNPDGSEIMSGAPKRHVLHPNVTEVGSERTGGPHLQLFGPNIQPRHCVVAHTDGLVTVTPCSRDAEVFVNGQRIFETSILQNGTVVKFGRIHNFRFFDPAADDLGRSRQQELAFDRLSKEDTGSTGTGGPNGASNASNYETTFDVDGNVETVSLKDLDARSQRSIASSRDGNRASGNYDRYPRGSDPILPAVLEVREETEEAFLNTVILDLDHSQLSFKLAPTYVLYLTARYRASTHFRPELLPTERAHRLTAMLARVAQFTHHTVEERYTDPASLAFWMANAAELLHFLKCDRHISAFSLDAQDILADAVQAAFRHLVACMQCELAAGMASFLSERDEDDTILGILCNAMALLRLCRVNAALTIQLFSHLFHFINMLAFNKIVSSPSNPQGINYCTRAWGVRLKARVAQLAAWAERQGLELAASCHLGRLAEAAYLLEAPKYNVTDLAQVSSTCLKLNSIQLRALLRGYQPGPNEPRLSLELIDNVVRVAENVADELARSDGREVKLEETPELQLAFLLPEDGFSCDVVRGLHQGLVDFVHSLQAVGLCRMSIQPTSSGVWTIYMADPNMHLRSPSSMSNRAPATQPPPEVQAIRLHKSNSGMGLSIVAAKGAGQDRLGIYIKSVVAGGAADADGRLQAGDQLLKVDGHSLVGITQEKAAEYLVRTGPIVTLEVAKQGAIYHGLATLLSQPSPLMARASKARPNGIPPSLSMGNLQQRRAEPQVPGLANGFLCPSSPSPVSFPSFNGLPAPCIPNIVILDVDAEDSGSCHDSDDPAKSAIFTQIRRVEFPLDDNGNVSDGTDRPLTREEADQCVAELQAIVADFERSTKDGLSENSVSHLDVINCSMDNFSSQETCRITDMKPKIKSEPELLSLDLSGVMSDSESTLPASEDSHQHLRLIKKQSKNAEGRKNDKFCSHPALQLFDPRTHSSKKSPLNKKALLAEDAKWGKQGKVATLANYFSSLGAAGMMSVAPSPLYSASEPSLTVLPPDLHDEVKKIAFGMCSPHSSSEPSLATLHVETQTSARRFAEDVETQTSARGRSEVQVQTTIPDYDYRLIYSLLKDEKKKKFPRDYIRRRKPAPKWHSVDVSLNETSQKPERKRPTGIITQPRLSSSQSVPSLSKLSGTVKNGVVRVYNVNRSTDQEFNPLMEMRARSRSAVAVTSPRRMSERDLPSRLGDDKRPGQMPIQSSKSVPSLNTGSGAGDQRPQELFNPGYSRTSSSNSIPHAPQTPLTYRSNQNLSETRGHVTHGLHPAQSTPSLAPSHAMYNSTPNSGYQATPTSQQSFPGSQSYMGTSYSYNDTQGSPHGGSSYSQHDGPHSPAADGGERFYQNLSVYPHGKAPSTNDISPGYQQRPGEALRDRERPASAYLPQYQPQNSTNVGMQGRSQSTRDIIRQEKLHEMSEEVRRREMRAQNPSRGPLVLMPGRSPAPGPRGPGHLSPDGYRGPISPGHPGHPPPADAYHPNYRPGMGHQMPPEGYRDGRMPQDGYRNAPMSPVSSEAYREGGPPRVPEEYRDSPPPPPPPVTTHPLMQKSLSPDNRYQASTGEAPRGGYYPAATADRRQYPYTGTNPWDREEKEKELARRKEAVRQWRDQQVSELSALTNRTPQQEEQLRALKLEREFERRAEEAKQEDEEEGEGDEETESSERVQGLLKMAQAQNGPIIRPATGSIAQMKLEDVRNKHAAGQNLAAKPSTPTKPNLAVVRDPNQLRMDQLSLNGPVTSPAQQYQQYNGYEKQNGGTPAPPERLSSYNTMQQLSPQQGSHPNTPYQQQGSHPNTSYQDRSYMSQEKSYPNQTHERSYPGVNQSQGSYQGMNMSQDRSFAGNQSQDRSFANQSQERSFATNQSVSSNYDRSYPGNQSQSFASNQSYQSQYNQERNFNHTQNSYNANQSQGSFNQSQAPMSPTRPNQLQGKRVSFSNTPVQASNQKLSPQSPQMERIVEDPNNFINEAESMLQSPTSPDAINVSTGNTPGVIGAQEVYRDPRTRMLAEQKQNTAPRMPGPEKLSFKEKMKMFAMETGEDSTPRDKVKISRAQRDIDNINSPHNNNNNTSVNNN